MPPRDAGFMQGKIHALVLSQLSGYGECADFPCDDGDCCVPRTCSNSGPTGSSSYVVNVPYDCSSKNLLSRLNLTEIECKDQCLETDCCAERKCSNAGPAGNSSVELTKHSASSPGYNCGHVDGAYYMRRSLSEFDGLACSSETSRCTLGDCCVPRRCTIFSENKLLSAL
jgi:hypothetical protein